MKLNTNSNVYTIIYATIMVVIVAVLLAVVSGSLKARQQANKELDTKKQILASLNERTLDNAAAEKFYSENVEPKHCDKCNLDWYEANVKGEKKYIIEVHGAGLWGPIWGYIALNDDKNTIFGTFFNHEGETPGLGAKIKEEAFQKEFEGHKIQNADKIGIGIEKAGGKADGMEQVDAISGATITSKGVETMILESLKPYAEAGWFNNK